MYQRVTQAVALATWYNNKTTTHLRYLSDFILGVATHLSDALTTPGCPKNMDTIHKIGDVKKQCGNEE